VAVKIQLTPIVADNETLDTVLLVVKLPKVVLPEIVCELVPFLLNSNQAIGDLENRTT
jgi:hypothetical protein